MAHADDAVAEAEREAVSVQPGSSETMRCAGTSRAGRENRSPRRSRKPYARGHGPRHLHDDALPPVGQAKLDLIVASGFRRFPPRLPERPIFVRSDFLAKYDVHIVGSRIHADPR